VRDRIATGSSTRIAHVFLFGTAKHGVVELLAMAINDLVVIR
jgi:hypothetical protein